jgi:hypothetical protein
MVREKILKWPHPIFAFLWLPPLWKGPGPWLVQFWIPFPSGWFSSSLIEIGLLVLERIVFKCLINFYSFAIISFWGKSCPSFVQFWIPFAQGYFVPNLVEIGPVVLGKIFEWSHPIFWILFYYLHLEMDLALDLYNFEFPLSKDDLYKVWLKLVRWF